MLAKNVTGTEKMIWEVLDIKYKQKQQDFDIIIKQELIYETIVNDKENFTLLILYEGDEVQQYFSCKFVCRFAK